MKNTQWDSNVFVDDYTIFSSVTIISKRPDTSIHRILNISAVLPELTSIQKTGREIKLITSSNLCSWWTKRGGSNCTICPMADERDSERSWFHHPLNQTEHKYTVVLFELRWKNSFSCLSSVLDVTTIEQWQNKAKANQFTAPQQLTSEVLKYIYIYKKKF